MGTGKRLFKHAVKRAETQREVHQVVPVNQLVAVEEAPAEHSGNVGTTERIARTVETVTTSIQTDAVSSDDDSEGSDAAVPIHFAGDDSSSCDEGGEDAPAAPKSSMLEKEPERYTGAAPADSTTAQPQNAVGDEEPHFVSGTSSPFSSMPRNMDESHSANKWATGTTTESGKGKTTHSIRFSDVQAAEECFGVIPVADLVDFAL